MDRFPWPLPLPGREVRLALANPGRKLFRRAAWIGALGLVFMALGPVRGDRGVYGAMVGLCGFALFTLATIICVMALRHAFRRDVVLVIDRDGVTLPRVLHFAGGVRRAAWAEIVGTSLSTQDGVFTGLVAARGLNLGLGQDQLPSGWNVSELMWRIQVRAQLARDTGHPDPLQAAGAEALGIYGLAAEAVVVVQEAEGPTVVDLVKSPDEYVAQLPNYPPDHRVVVPSDTAMVWGARVPQNLVQLALPLPPRTT